jgi:hypothetical protein
VVEDKAMSAREFRDDDGYLAWLAAHPDGYVINIARSHSATEARVHHAGCRTINGQNPRAGTWTGPYVKVCAEQLDELDRWAIDQVGEPIRRCGICHRARDTRRTTATKQTERADGRPVLDGRWDINEPAVDSAVVETWADDYIRFERRPAWQDHLRDEIRSRCGQLEPSAGQVLHATFFGAKRPNADVENLLLYYFDSFKVAGRNGVRFELGARVPLAPDGVEYPFCYRYALAPRSGTFADWQHGERWPRSTGPTWARSLARRRWLRFGWRSPAASSRRWASRRPRPRRHLPSKSESGRQAGGRGGWINW